MMKLTNYKEACDLFFDELQFKIDKSIHAYDQEKKATINRQTKREKERLSYPPADIFSNAPLALIQVALKNQRDTLKWILNQ